MVKATMWRVRWRLLQTLPLMWRVMKLMALSAL
jgi:hypothetical protein